MPIPTGLPTKLYGRQRHAEALLEAFERASAGPSEIVLLPGRSGAGKTALVESVRGPVRERNGWFVSGKYDQYQRNTPYFALREAFAALWQEMIALERLGVIDAGAELREAVGELGAVLVELVPELASVFPEAAHRTDIGLHEARHRFASAVRGFLAVAAQPEHPVVLFVDDWQWADRASIELLRQLEVHDELEYVLVVAAYRSEEVGPHHPFRLVLDQLAREIRAPRTVEVENLVLHDIVHLTEDTFGPALDAPETIARHVVERTEGNPFHVHAYLAHVRRTGMLAPDDAGRWTWSEDGRGASGSVVDLFAALLETMDLASRRLAGVAACLGARFRRDDLRRVSALAPEAFDRAVRDLLDARLLVAGDALDELRFRHDRIQQAAFQAIPDDEIASTRLRMAHLLAELDAERAEDRTYAIAEHLDAARDLIDDDAGIVDAVERTLRAAGLARTQTAYETMLRFHRSAAGFVASYRAGAEDFWRDHYDTAVAVYRGLAESEFVAGDTDAAENAVASLVDHHRTARERAESLSVEIVHLTLLARYPEAIAAGRRALDELGIHLPDADYEHHRDEAIAAAMAALGGDVALGRADDPLVSDPDIQTAIRLLITMGPPCYRTHQRLWSVIVPIVVRLTLEHGLAPQIGYSHTAFGGLLGWVSGDLTHARRFGDLATAIMTRRFVEPMDQSVFYLMRGSSTTHWFAPLAEASEDFQKAYDIGLQAGNLQYAAYAFGHDMYCRFFQGENLHDLLRRTEQSHLFATTRRNQWAIDLFESGYETFVALSGEEPTFRARFDDGDVLDRIVAHRNVQVECIHHVFTAFRRVLEDDLAGALDASDRAAALLETVGTQGLLPWPEHCYVRAVILARLDANGHRRELATIRDRLERWAGTAPWTYGFRVAHIDAELAAANGEVGNAIAGFDRAIDAAREHGFVQWELALAERLAHLCLGWDLGAFAQSAFERAFEAAAAWGADGLIPLLAERYRTGTRETLERRDPRGEGTRDALVESQLEATVQHARHALELEELRRARVRNEELAEATEHLRTEIAARRQLEEQLKASNQALERFAYVASHDLQEPLRMVTSYLQLIERRYADALDDKGREFIGYAVDGAIRMKELIHDLLAFARINTRGAKPEPVEVDEAIEAARRLLAEAIEDRNASLEIDAMPRVVADVGQLTTVFQNLVSNALKFSDHDRPAVRIGARRRGNFWEITVSDDGIGIDPSHHEDVFEIFRRLHSIADYAGTGIGLALVKQIVERHGGTIGVDSAPGEGSTFRFTLPAAD